MAKDKNKQRKEKRKKRIKHPDLGRTKAVGRSSSQKGIVIKPKPCPECKQLKKCIKVCGGSIIKHICKCNEYLVDIELEKIHNKQVKKELNCRPNTVRTLEFTP